MEIMENASGCPAISQLIESSKTLNNDRELVEHLKWIPYSEFTNIESIEHSTDNQPTPTYYATYEQAKKQYDYEGNIISSYKLVEMLLLGTVDECTQEFIHEFARTYSLPTYKYDNPSNINQFRRYPTWLKRRNWMIEGFTSDNHNYYLVARRHFHHCYFRYGF